MMPLASLPEVSVNADKLKGSAESMSLALSSKLTLNAASSSVAVFVSAALTSGASLTAVIVRLTVAVSVLPAAVVTV